jgi:hypothetical protein
LFWLALPLLAIPTAGCVTDTPLVVTFVNDLNHPVVLALCHSDHSDRCDDAYYRDSLAAGESGSENISYLIKTEWAVESTSGQLLRCVVLLWKKNPGILPRIRLSNTPRWQRPCPDSTRSIDRS